MSCYTYPADRNLDANFPRSIKCIMLMVWEYGLGIKESLIGGILLPESSPTRIAEKRGLGRGGTRLDKNTIVLAFWQVSWHFGILARRPCGPTFLNVDFWKDKYFDDDYTKLMVLLLVDSLSYGGMPLRTITCYVMIMGALAQYASISLTKVST
ncbi:hypothetical protein M758_UG126600 [Ceratodon purpureus]|nr:hypothetical protein M758_UG126600 [Ceratodon purpureus]